MLIEDVEKLIKQLREEQGMKQEEVRKETFKRALEDLDNDFEVERGFDRPRGRCLAHYFAKLEGEPESEGDVAWEDDWKPSERKRIL